ncbi:hypothetical protein NECID01_1711 [Nematocida sp. AWRm77]|nr:hypothetical protein NECID01_1711 [Nematocida sp. AWRm77]
MVYVVCTAWRVGWALFLLGVCLRLLFIAHPGSCVFDEVHYVRFIGKYLKRESVVDVHPPLGRLLFYGLVRAVLDKDADLLQAGNTLASFGVGQSFAHTALEHVYPVLRACSCLSSFLLVWVGYYTFSTLGVSSERALLLSCMLLFEGALHSMFRLFMVDSHVLLCCSVVLLCLLNMNKLRIEESLSRGAPSRKGRRKIRTRSITESLQIKPAEKAAEKVLKKHLEKEKQADTLSAQSQRVSFLSLVLSCAHLHAWPHTLLHSLGWASLLGCALGAGVSFKWSVLPMGGPIAVFLLLDVCRALQARKKTPFRWVLPCVQGFLILFFSLGVYLCAFAANFYVQDRYTPSTSQWFSFEYSATLEGNPFSSLSRRMVLEESPFILGMPGHRGFLSVNAHGDLSIVPEYTSKDAWRVVRSSTHLHASNSNSNSSSGLLSSSLPLSEGVLLPVTFGQEVYLQHESGVYLSSSSSSLVSASPSSLSLEKVGGGGVGGGGGGGKNACICIGTPAQKYFSISQRNEAAWGSDKLGFLLFSLMPAASPSPPSTSLPPSSAVFSHTVSPLSFLGKVVEANLVMARSNKYLSSAHKYASHPLEWLRPFRHIHMWNGGTSECSSQETKYGSSAQIFFTFNPVLLSASVCALGLCLSYVVLTQTKHASTHVLLLMMYLSNYVPYLFLVRDTYLHHYLPAYYASLVVLGYVLSFLPSCVLFLFLSVSAGVHLLQYPLLTGRPSSHEACMLFTNRSSILCHALDSLPGWRGG